MTAGDPSEPDGFTMRAAGERRSRGSRGSRGSIDYVTASVPMKFVSMRRRAASDDPLVGGAAMPRSFQPRYSLPCW